MKQVRRIRKTAQENRLVRARLEHLERARRAGDRDGESARRVSAPIGEREPGFGLREPLDLDLELGWLHRDVQHRALLQKRTVAGGHEQIDRMVLDRNSVGRQELDLRRDRAPSRELAETGDLVVQVQRAGIERDPDVREREVVGLRGGRQR